MKMKIEKAIEFSILSTFSYFPDRLTNSLNMTTTRLIFSVSATFLAMILSINLGWAQAPVLPPSSDNPIWQVRQTPALETEQLLYKYGSEIQICGMLWQMIEEYTASKQHRIAGYFRAEGEKGYFRRSLDCATPEYLIYDYALEIGDTMKLHFGLLEAFQNVSPATSFDYVVYNTDSVEIAGMYHKTIFLGSTDLQATVLDFTIWTAGYGDYRHPFYLLYPASGDLFSFLLGCVWTNEGLEYDVNCDWERPAASIWYVDADVQGGLKNGSSWPNAFDNLQEGLFYANPGDTIWVAEGTYLPTDFTLFNSTDRYSSFLLQPGVTVLGGFQGIELTSQERQPYLFPAILSGDIGIQGDSTDNVYHVVQAVGTDSLSRLDGFTIEAGQGLDSAQLLGPNSSGGGLLVLSNEAIPANMPMIAHCVFQNNRARFGGAVHGEIRNEAIGWPRLQDCRFEQNHAFFQGGGLNLNSVNTEAFPDYGLLRDTFVNNHALSGGGLSVTGTGQFRVQDVIFGDNYAREGAGAIINNSNGTGQITFQDCVFQRNAVATNGGGILLYSTSIMADAGGSLGFAIRNCLFQENISDTHKGSAIHLGTGSSVFSGRVENSTFENNIGQAVSITYQIKSYSNLTDDFTFESCQFLENKAPTKKSGGAIVAFGTDSSLGVIRNLNIRNSTFDRNEGALGLYIQQNAELYTTVNHCTFFNNGLNPVIKNWKAEPGPDTWINRLQVRNSIFWEEKTAIEGPRGIFYNSLVNNVGFENYYDFDIDYTLISSPPCVWLSGCPEAFGEQVIHEVYPHFLDTLSGDLRLSACSPALNTGQNEVVTSDTDLEDNNRILEGIVDLGAYERLSFELSVDSVAAPLCAEGEDGVVFFAPTGEAPLTYSWSGNDISGIRPDSLPAGSYQFTITDASNCRDTLTVTVPEQMPIHVESIVTPANETVGGSIFLQSVSGGTPPYNYNWSTGSNMPSLSGLPPGIYQLTITDANNCEETWPFEVEFVSADITEERPPGVLKLFPNPVASGALVHWSLAGFEQENVQVLLMHATGALVRKLLLRSGASLSTEYLPTGLYEVQILNADGQVAGRGRLVISRQ